MNINQCTQSWERLTYEIHVMYPKLDSIDLSHWKLSLQQVVNMTMNDYVDLPKRSRTGLQFLHLFGHHYTLQMTEEHSGQALQMLPVIIQRMMQTFCYIMWTDQPNDRVLHLYTLDESIPSVVSLTSSYLEGHYNWAEKYESIVMHLLLKNKTIILKQDHAYI